MDGFNVSFHGDQLCIHYHGEVTMKEVHNKSFESDMEQMIADISKFIKKQYRGATKSSLTLKKEGDIDVMVQSVGEHRSWVQAKQYFSYGSDADSIANESDDKLDSAIKNFIELGRDGAKKNAADSRSASDKKAPENNMRETKMKISKTRLKDIIKEELTKFNIRRMSEDANDDTFEMLDALTGAMGETAVLENIVQAMDRQTAHTFSAASLKTTASQWVAAKSTKKSTESDECPIKYRNNKY